MLLFIEIPAFLSLGSEIIALLYYLNNQGKLRPKQFQLMIVLVIFGLLGNIVDFLYIFSELSIEFCIIISYIRHVLFQATYFWMLIISFYCIGSQENQEPSEYKLSTKVLASFVISGILNGMIFIFSDSDPFPFNEIGCFPDYKLAIIFFYIPMFICTVVLLYTLWKIFRTDPNHEKEVIKALMIYALFVAICWVPGMVYRLFQLIGSENIEWLFKTVLVFSRILGFANSFYFLAYSNKWINENHSQNEEIPLVPRNC
jgi:hypothetical protein